ncbi:MAG: NAD(P)-binding domain-containing protein [Thermococcus sp.]
MKVLFIGFGNMGSAIGRAWLEKGILPKEDLLIVVKSEKHREELHREAHRGR